jgi:hypothetical protein
LSYPPEAVYTILCLAFCKWDHVQHQLWRKLTKAILILAQLLPVTLDLDYAIGERFLRIAPIKKQQLMAKFTQLPHYLAPNKPGPPDNQNTHHNSFTVAPR